jgi:hypothetical protein
VHCLGSGSHSIVGAVMEISGPPEVRISCHIIAVEALPQFEAMVGEHNRRVVMLSKRHKIEIAPASIRTLRTFQAQRIPADIGSGSWKFVSPIDSSDPKAVRFWAEVEVSGQRAVISGWEIVASLTLTDAGYLLSPVTGAASDYDSHRERGGTCDHCKTSRQRSVTYLLRKDSEVRAVGSKCLRDFTGHMSPTAWAAYADSLVGFEHEISDLEDEDFGEEESAGQGRRLAEAVPISKYLPFVAMEIRINGWLSKGKAWSGGGTPTADVAWEIMVRRQGEPTEEDRCRAVEDFELVTETFASKEDREDYEDHLMSVINQGYVFFRNMGLVASICAAADRIRRDQALAEARRKEVSEWFGEVGQRGDYVLRLVHTQSYDGRFGVSYLHIFVDERGRKAKWFATGKCLDKGTYEIKATVKKHEVYQDRKETLLTRCSVVREIVASPL